MGATLFTKSVNFQLDWCCHPTMPDTKLISFPSFTLSVCVFSLWRNHARLIVTHNKVEKSLLVRHNQTLHFITFPASGRPHYVTCEQELLVFRAVTAFRCENEDSKSDLTPMQDYVIVGARCGSLLYTFTKKSSTRYYTFNFIFLRQCIHSKHVK